MLGIMELLQVEVLKKSESDLPHEYTSRSKSKTNFLVTLNDDGRIDRKNHQNI